MANLANWNASGNLALVALSVLMVVTFGGPWLWVGVTLLVLMSLSGLVGLAR